MNIKEVAQLTGLSHQAIYKKIKTAGLTLETLKDKETGQFTPDGEAAIMALFDVKKPDATEVEKLKEEVEKLRNQVAAMEKEISALTEERNFLRVSLDRSQQLVGMTLAKIPAPPPALPSGDEKGIRGWFKRRRKKDAD